VHYNVEGAEAYVHFRQRIINALNLLAAEPAESVAVVTHGGPIRLIFRDVLKLGEIDIDDCAVAVLESLDDSFRLKKTDRIKLLEKTR
jgi:broad specificity phosphatase PhoE